MPHLTVFIVFVIFSAIKPWFEPMSEDHGSDYESSAFNTWPGGYPSKFVFDGVLMFRKCLASGLLQFKFNCLKMYWKALSNLVFWRKNIIHRIDSSIRVGAPFSYDSLVASRYKIGDYKYKQVENENWFFELAKNDKWKTYYAFFLIASVSPYILLFLLPAFHFDFVSKLIYLNKISLLHVMCLKDAITIPSHLYIRFLLTIL